MKNFYQKIGLFILGIPLAFYSLFFLSGYYVEGIGPLSFLVVVYGFLSYYFGRLWPGRSWKSGLLMSLAPIFLGVFTFVGIFMVPESIDKDFPYIYTSLNFSLFFISIISITIILSLLSYLGSRSQK